MVTRNHDGSGVRRRTQHFTASQLARARELRGYNRSELAAKVSVSSSAIAQYERGVCKPDSQTLMQIALTLGFPTEFFSRTPPTDGFDAGECHFRSLRKTPKYKRRQAVRAVSLHLEMLYELRGVVRHEGHDLAALRDRADELDPEEMAEAVREAWGLDDAPMYYVLPELERRGVLILPLQRVYREVHAFSFWHGDTPVICLDFDQPPSKIHFDALHELGHLLMHDGAIPGAKETEREANWFARAMQLPVSTFAATCPERWSFNKFGALKKAWRVSLGEMIERAYQIGKLSSESRKNAYISLNKKGVREHEPFEWQLDGPRVLLSMLWIARDRLSLDELARRMCVHKWELEMALSPLEPYFQQDQVTERLSLVEADASTSSRPPAPANDDA